MTQCRVIGIEWPNWEPLNYILFSEYMKDIRELEEENKKLKDEIVKLGCKIWAWQKIKAIEDENRNLKSELSKFRDSFKKYRDYEKEELAESCYDLARENEKLKEEIRWLRDTQYTHCEPVVSSWWVWGQIYII